MPTRKIVTTAILFVLLAAGITYSQSKNVAAFSEIYNIAPDGSKNYSNKNISNQNELIKELKKAKDSGDRNKINEVQSRLNEMNGSYQMQTIPITNVAHPQDIYQGDNLNFSQIHPNHAISSNAISTDRTTGIIYTAYTRYLSSACDEVYIYKSTTNGLTWSFFYSISVPSYPNLNYEPDQFDMEVVNKGDSTYIFGVLGASNGPDAYPVFYFRVRQDGQMFTFNSINNAGATNLRLHYPRISSDNARYNAAYIYISYTLDSIVGTRKFLKTKLGVLENAFAPTLQLTMKNSGPSGSYFYYTSESQHDSAFMQSDICYVNVPGDSDAVVMASVLRGTSSFNGTSIYLSSSPNFGTLVTSSYQINDTKLFESPRIASPGYLSRNVMIAVRRLFENLDWDPYIFKSITFNRTAGNFNLTANLNPTTDTTLYIDLAARYGSHDNFMIIFANRWGNFASGSAAVHKAGLLSYYSFTPNGWGVTSENGAPVAGFRNVNNDSCIIGWANQNTFGYNVTAGCGGTMTGTENNSSVAEGYALAQNFPNPFNPSTKISFSLKQNSFVKLTVYDGLGREITKLVNQITQAGRHEVEFNAIGLPSGVYYYKLEAEGFSEVKKMLLIK